MLQLAKAAGRLGGHHGSSAPTMGGGRNGKGKSGAASNPDASGLVAAVQALAAVAGLAGFGSGGKGKGKAKGERPFLQGDWLCEAKGKGGGRCGCHNFAWRTECFSCGALWVQGEPSVGKGKNNGAGGTKGGGQGSKAKGPEGADGNRPLLSWGRGTGPNTRDTNPGGKAGAGACGDAGSNKRQGIVRTADGFSTLQRSGKPRGAIAGGVNQWSAFAEDHDEDDNDSFDGNIFGPLDAEEYRSNEELDEETGRDAGYVDEYGDSEGEDDGDEGGREQGQEEDEDVHPSRLQRLQDEHDGNKAMVRALQGLPRWDPAVTRAKALVAISREELDKELQTDRGPKPVQTRIRTVQRKIGNTKKKLEQVQGKRQELRQRFEEDDWVLEEKESELQSRLQEFEEQFRSTCGEAATAGVCTAALYEATKSTASIDNAGTLVQDLLSRAEDDQMRQSLNAISKDLEGARTAIGRLAQGYEERGGQEQWKAECHDMAHGETEGSQGESTGQVAAVPPASWMRQEKPSDDGKKVSDGVGKGAKKKRMGNVAKQFIEAQEHPNRRPTHEEEAEFGGGIVAELDDRHKGQLLTEEDKQNLLQEGMRKMAAWIQSGGARLHARSSTEEFLESMETMAKCKSHIESAVVLLATRRAEDARAASAAAGTGAQTGAAGS